MDVLNGLSFSGKTSVLSDFSKLTLISSIGESIANNILDAKLRSQNNDDFSELFQNCDLKYKIEKDVITHNNIRLRKSAFQI